MMSVLRSLGLSALRNRNMPSGIDLGDGRQLRAEDVLEGHFRRLAASTCQSEELRVQVTPTFSAAIRVMAPQLAPLTQIAEELASTFPNVSPAPDFRRDLHQALEMAHRQHTAQRAGASLPAERAVPVKYLLWLALGATLSIGALVGVLGVWRLKNRRQTRNPAA